MSDFPVEMWIVLGAFWVIVTGFMLWLVGKAFPYPEKDDFDDE